MCIYIFTYSLTFRRLYLQLLSPKRVRSKYTRQIFKLDFLVNATSHEKVLFYIFTLSFLVESPENQLHHRLHGSVHYQRIFIPHFQRFSMEPRSSTSAVNLEHRRRGRIPRIKTWELSYAGRASKFRKYSETWPRYKYRTFHVLLSPATLPSDCVFLKCRLRNASECKYLIKGYVSFGKCVEVVVYLRCKNTALRVLLFINAHSLQ